MQKLNDNEKERRAQNTNNLTCKIVFDGKQNEAKKFRSGRGAFHFSMRLSWLYGRRLQVENKLDSFYSSKKGL